MVKKSKEENKSYRTEQFIIKKGHPLNEYLMDMMHKSNNLYNATNFHLRQLWTGLKIEDVSKLHPLQQEVIALFENTIPIVNKNNETKYKKLIEKDKASGIKPKKERKLTIFSMPTKDNSFCSYELMDAVLKTSKNIDYNSLPAHVNQGVMKQVYSDWKSFLKDLKNIKSIQTSLKANLNHLDIKPKVLQMV